MPPKENLDTRYKKTIDDQRDHLLKLQAEFNDRCGEIRKKAQGKLTEAKEREGKEVVLKEQKKQLEEALARLKEEVNRSTRQTMKTLEEIQREREKLVLEDIEKQIAAA